MVGPRVIDIINMHVHVLYSMLRDTRSTWFCGGCGHGHLSIPQFCNGCHDSLFPILVGADEAMNAQPWYAAAVRRYRVARVAHGGPAFRAGDIAAISWDTHENEWHHDILDLPRDHVERAHVAAGLTRYAPGVKSMFELLYSAAGLPPAAVSGSAADVEALGGAITALLPVVDTVDLALALGSTAPLPWHDDTILGALALAFHGLTLAEKLARIAPAMGRDTTPVDPPAWQPSVGWEMPMATPFDRMGHAAMVGWLHHSEVIAHYKHVLWPYVWHTATRGPHWDADYESTPVAPASAFGSTQEAFDYVAWIRGSAGQIINRGHALPDMEGWFLSHAEKRHWARLRAAFAALGGLTSNALTDVNAAVWSINPAWRGFNIARAARSDIAGPRPGGRLRPAGVWTPSRQVVRPVPGPSEGFVSCLHGLYAVVGESGPTGSTPALPCGCRPGRDDHTINRGISVWHRPAGWTSVHR